MAKGPKKTVSETKTEKTEPQVSIFNEDITNNTRYWDNRHDSGNSVWGVLLVYAGIILVLNALNIIPWEYWKNIWQFWPILIILGGIHIILGNNPISRLILFVFSVVAFGLITIWGLKQIHSPLVNNIPSDWINFMNWLEAQRR